MAADSGRAGKRSLIADKNCINLDNQRDHCEQRKSQNCCCNRSDRNTTPELFILERVCIIIPGWQKPDQANGLRGRPSPAGQRTERGIDVVYCLLL